MAQLFFKYMNTILSFFLIVSVWGFLSWRSVSGMELHSEGWNPGRSQQVSISQSKSFLSISLDLDGRFQESCCLHGEIEIVASVIILWNGQWDLPCKRNTSLLVWQFIQSTSKLLLLSIFYNLNVSIVCQLSHLILFVLQISIRQLV